MPNGYVYNRPQSFCHMKFADTFAIYYSKNMMKKYTIVKQKLNRFVNWFCGCVIK